MRQVPPDLVLTGGQIIDGVGTPPYVADIAIAGDQIAQIGELSPSKGAQTLDISGLAVCPGFVDIHSHSDYHILVCPKAESKVRQGVTTEVVGNCGYSAAPIWGEVREQREKFYGEQFGLKLNWETMEGYARSLTEQGVAVNIAPLVGHNTLRASVDAQTVVAPTEKQLRIMKGALEEALDWGAWGLSLGLAYPPGCYASSPELQALVTVAASYGRPFTAHIRNEGDGLLEALREALEVARATGGSLQISHLKTAGEKNWGKLNQAFLLIEEAIADGLEVSCDRYPYLAGQTGLSAVLPDWVFEGGQEHFLARLTEPYLRNKIITQVLEKHPEPDCWDKVVISRVSNSEYRHLEGRSIAKISQSGGKPPVEQVLDLLFAMDGQVEALYFSMSEENLRRILAKPYTMIGSDSAIVAHYGPLSHGKPHPRACGTFPKVLSRYVKEGLFTLEEAIQKMTSAPCHKLGITSRGQIASGKFADLVVFNPQELQDQADYQNPIQYPGGIRYVFVNGRLVVKDGEHTGTLPGRILRHTR